jgi:chromosome segregation ATPase
MPETLNTRVTSLEESMRRAFNAIESLTEKEKRLDDVLVLLTEAQIATQQSFQETERQFQETERRFQETERRFQETDERFRKTDERFEEMGNRIESLVSAIGALLSGKPV